MKTLTAFVNGEDKLGTVLKASHKTKQITANNTSFTRNTLEIIDILMQ